MELPHYPRMYAGKEGFEMFLRTHFMKHSLPTEIRREILFTKRDFQDNYTNFCCVYGYPVASVVNTGKHLGFLGITIKAYLGPQGNQFPCYNDILSLREAYDLLALWKVDEEHPDLTCNMSLDNTSVSSCSYHDTDNNTTTNDTCVSYHEVNTSLKEDHLKTENVQQTVNSTHDCGWRDTFGYTCPSWNTDSYTKQDRINVFEYVTFLEDFVASL